VISRTVRVVNTLGLHARAAAKFVGLAGRFRSRIQVTRAHRTVDGKSILGLLLLSGARGIELTIQADGDDEATAIDALADLVAQGFGES
jgi:phosphotransferase system HPr (HPr) family protein